MRRLWQNIVYILRERYSKKGGTMEDSKIIDLFWARSEFAIKETANKYSRYCYSISYNIVSSHEDAEECVNDTYLKAWNSMPPTRPNYFRIFLGKITRNISIDKYKKSNTKKRGRGQIELVLTELDECISTIGNIEDEIEEKELIKIINNFLESLPKEKRIIFVQRYWYLMTIKDIAEQQNDSESKVKSILFRIRVELKKVLEREGIIL